MEDLLVACTLSAPKLAVLPLHVHDEVCLLQMLYSKRILRVCAQIVSSKDDQPNNRPVLTAKPSDLHSSNQNISADALSALP